MIRILGRCRQGPQHRECNMPSSTGMRVERVETTSAASPASEAAYSVPSPSEDMSPTIDNHGAQQSIASYKEIELRWLEEEEARIRARKARLLANDPT